MFKRIIMLAGASMTSMTFAVDLSPGQWPKAERERVERLERRTYSPTEARTVETRRGLISATVSPIAVYAGVQALNCGGTAADAAAVTALTQVTTQLGSVVSYAGVFTMLYYDAKERKVYSLDAGYNSYLHETDPKSIPACDLGPTFKGLAIPPTPSGAKGRETLVPGFMAGVEAMHQRFGRLPFRDLFQPATWYAEHGVQVSPLLRSFFVLRAKYLARTPEGREFLRGGGGQKRAGKEAEVRGKIDDLLAGGSAVPLAGDLFRQPELAKNLKAISEQGARYMYTGQWAEDFVRIVQREGGKATLDDLKRYAPIWSEPYHQTVFGHTVYVNGPPHFGAYALFAGLNLAEALELDRKEPYWQDPGSLQVLARVARFAGNAAQKDNPFDKVLAQQGVDISPKARLGKDYARAVIPLLERAAASQSDRTPKHSNAIVVIDKEGNIAAITHSINTVIWGDTGIVVDGIPLPDAAGFQQFTLARLKPGDRVPHSIIDTIVFAGQTPVLATGSIGSSLVPESIRVLLGVLGQRQDLATVMAAPPLLESFDALSALNAQSIEVPEGAYSQDFVAKASALGLKLSVKPAQTAAGLRGTLAAVAIDPKTGQRSAADRPGVMVFNQKQ